MSAGPAACFVAEQEAFEGGLEVGSAFGVEAGAGCLEGVFEVVVGFAFVGFEEELVCAGVERECEVSEGVDGGLVGAGFVAADVGDVEACEFGEAGVFAGGDESGGEGGGGLAWSLAEVNRPGFCIRFSKILRGLQNASTEGIHP